jgi:hypothetical protein
MSPYTAVFVALIAWLFLVPAAFFIHWAFEGVRNSMTVKAEAKARCTYLDASGFCIFNADCHCFHKTMVEREAAYYASQTGEADNDGFSIEACYPSNKPAPANIQPVTAEDWEQLTMMCGMPAPGNQPIDETVQPVEMDEEEFPGYSKLGG